MKITTLCPRFCSPTAASIINLSAPPMPRSGWKKTILFSFFSGVAIVSSGLELFAIWRGLETDLRKSAMRKPRVTAPRECACEGKAII